MKQILLPIFLFACLFSNAQNVGVGETSPASKMTVKGNLSIGTGYSTTAAPANGAIIQGNVGIGVVNPASNLDVYNNTAHSAVVANFFGPNNTAVSDLTFIRVGVSASLYNSSEFRFGFAGNSSTSNYVQIGLYGTGNGISINANYVGINTTTPAYPLDVNGKTRTSTFAMTTGAAAGDILQSDASGNATWVTPGSIATTNIYNTDGTLTATRTMTMAGNALNLNGGTLTTNQDASVHGITVGTGTGSYAFLNTAVGVQALQSNTTGSYNTANGYNALSSNTTGVFNTAIGAQALLTNTTGYINTANGENALYYNTTGSGNTANGDQALYDNTTGNSNTAIGLFALSSNSTGSSNSAFGYSADVASSSLTNATAIGANALVAVSNAVVIGSISGVSGASVSANVGIGTTSPAYPLDVNGVINTATGFKVAGGAAAATYLRGNGTNFVQSAIQASDVPTLNQNTTGNAATATTSGSFSSSLAGDVTGTQGATVVGKIQTTPVTITSLATNNLLQYNGTAWVNVPPSAIAATNIYNTNGTLTAARTVTMGGNALNLNGGTLTTNQDASMHSLTIGQGAGSISTNTAVGVQALQVNTTGYDNAANGTQALYHNTTGLDNAAYGFQALYSNTIGNENTANGSGTLHNNTTGNINNANGFQALYSNINGSINTANGATALFNNNSGNYNTASGFQALFTNYSGNGNTANGYNTLVTNNTGSYNSALGYSADVASSNLTNATAIGANAQVSASNAIVLGSINGVNGATASANVGIGTTSPAYPLDVNGKTRTSTFAMTTGAAAGDILQSDASGNATWVTPASLTATNIYNTDGTLTAARTMTMAGNALNLNGGTLTTNQDAYVHGITVGTGTGSNASLNTAVGAQALHSNTTGTYNTANGYNALSFNTTGVENTAHGAQALYSNTSGTNNTSTGFQALVSNTIGYQNTANGVAALVSNTTGNNNSAFGYYANVASGNLNNATAIGAYALVAASNAVVIGSISGVNGAGASANVGIGTSSPAYPLDVNGVINTATGFKVAGGATTATYLRGNGTNFVQSAIQAGDLPSLSGNYVDLTTAQTAAGAKTWSGNATFSSGTIALNNAGSNMITYPTSGSAIPTFTTSSAGTRLLLYPSAGAGLADYAIGIANSTIWHSVPQPTSSFWHSFYGGTTELMRIQGDGKVGIGTTAPAVSLDVVSPTFAAAQFFAPSVTGVGLNALIRVGIAASINNSAELRLLNGATSAANVAQIGLYGGAGISVNSSGSLGVGTSAPAYPLDVNGVINTATGFKVAGGATTATYLRGNGTNYLPSTIQASDLPSLSGNYVDLTTAQTAAGIKTWSSNAIFNGNVGVGTASPLIKMDFALGSLVGTTATSVAENDLSNRGTKIQFGAYSNTSLSEFLGMSAVVNPGTRGCGNSGDLIFNTWECNTSASREVMRINGTGFVGVNTTAPYSALSNTPSMIVGSDGIYSSTSGIAWSNNGGGYIIGAYNSSAATNSNGLAVKIAGTAANNRLFDLSTGATSAGTGVTVMAALGNGNVGIGTGSPAYPLDVNGVINTATGFKVAGAATTGNYLRGNGTNFISSGIQATDIPSLSGTYVDLTTAQTAAGIKTWSNNAVFNGTTQVLGATTTHSSQGAYIEWNKDGGGGATWFMNQKGGGGGGFNFGEVSTANAITSRMVIDGSGNIGIGTTTPFTQLSNTSINILASNNDGLLAPSLDWAVNTGAYTAGFFNASTAVHAHGLEVKIAGTASSNKLLDLSTGPSQATAGTTVMMVQGDGKVGIGTGNPTALLSVNGAANNTTGAWGVFSDARVKTVTGDFTDGLNVIKKIHTVKFNYNADAPFKANGEQIGIVAQELEKIAPYMVSQKEYKDLKDLREVNNQAYVFLLINGMQEQQKTIEEQQKQLDEQNKKIDLLMKIVGK